MKSNRWNWLDRNNLDRINPERISLERISLDRISLQRISFAAGVLVFGLAFAFPVTAQSDGPASLVNPLIGRANGGNDYPGAMLPFGMLAWSPEQPSTKLRKRVEGVPGSLNDDRARPAAPGGYEYTATKIRGFSVTHMMGIGCAGGSGDIPFMPVVGDVTSSPSADAGNALYASEFSHADEIAQAGYYRVKMANGVTAELTATLRTGAGRFTYPAGKTATMLVRTSDSETGSEKAEIWVNEATRTISGSVTSGNFCGYLGTTDRRSYYRLYFVAHFDKTIASLGTWRDGIVNDGGTRADGGTTYGEKGFPPPGKGSGGWVTFADGAGPVGFRVGISYVSLANAEANLEAENPEGTSFDTVRAKAHATWNEMLNRIAIEGGTTDQRTVFYTALYHTLLGENLYSDVDGSYRGMDGSVHQVAAPQKAQYSTFSGWDVYRSQLQLVTLIAPQIGSDIAQSLLNQANQNNGEWDRWTHASGGTHVMNGDPAAPAIADILAFGGERFDVKAAYASLLHAATVPTGHDRSNEGCPVECVGQRPSLDLWMKLHYIPTEGNAWGPAADTLEDVTADFAVAELARRMGDTANEKLFLERAQYWKNIFNPAATGSADEGAFHGYIQNRMRMGAGRSLIRQSRRASWKEARRSTCG